MDRETKKIVIETLNELKKFSDDGIDRAELMKLEEVSDEIIHVLESHDLIELDNEKYFLSQFGYEVLEEGMIDVGQFESAGGLATALKELSKDFQMSNENSQKNIKKYVWAGLVMMALGLTFYQFLK